MLKKTILVVATVLVTVAVLMLGIAFVYRLQMPYNSEGNYFDENAIIVYHRQTMEIMGFSTFTLFIILFFLLKQFKHN